MQFGFWSVKYRDGSFLSQYDETHESFMPSSEHVFDGEVPYKAIKWSEVVEVIFTNTEGINTVISIPSIPHYLRWGLGSRHFKPMAGAGEAMCFRLLLYRATLDESPTADNIEKILYWFPDTSMHECTLFDCPDVYQYGSNLIWNKPQKGLMPTSSALKTTFDYVTAK